VTFKIFTADKRKYHNWKEHPKVSKSGKFEGKYVNRAIVTGIQTLPFLYGNVCWKATACLPSENSYKSLSKRETLKAVNFFLICLILFKFSTFTNFSMLFQVMLFSFVFDENLKSHVAGVTSPFQA